MKVSRVLHAGYIFEAGGTRLLFDPVFETPFSENCFPFPAVEFDTSAIRSEKFDAVFISHYHDDHCSFVSLDLLDRTTPIYIFCVHDELLDLIRELGFTSVITLALNFSVNVGEFNVTARRALDADVDSVLQIVFRDVRILNVVDSWIDDETLQLLIDEGPWDLILWPFQTMLEIDVMSPSRAAPPSRSLPPEWVEQIRLLNPRFIVPSSCQFIQEDWSWQRLRYFPISYAQFACEISSISAREISQLRSNGAIKTVRLNPGVSIEISSKALQPSKPLPWIRTIGEQNVDYDFAEQAPVQSVAEISARLGEVSLAAFARVIDYCRVGLLDRVRELEVIEPYFESNRVWQLNVVGHNGNTIKFRYSICGAEISLLEDSESLDDLKRSESIVDPKWLTEIPMIKLYNALEKGEALNSLYVRINDTRFSPAIEAELQDADILNDPLLRALYEGKFATYQKAQLALLRGTR